MLNVLIVDDEPLAHDVLAHLCEREAGIKIMAQCLSAAEALRHLEQQAIDVMFLDIRMPVFGGLDLLKGLADPPLTVIVSAHEEHAFEGFALDVVDYLLKPVSASRFAEAIAKVRRRQQAKSSEQTEQPDLIALKVDRAIRCFYLDDIALFRAQGNFVAVVSDDQTSLATTTMKHLSAHLPADRFVQIHRSCIVNRQRVVEQRLNELLLDNGQTVAIGRSYRRTNKTRLLRNYSKLI